MQEKGKSTKELFNEYSVDVLNYSMSLLKNSFDAEDALQEVFERYLKSQDSFRGECSYKTWLLVITRNYCYQKINGRAKEPIQLDETILKLYEPRIEDKITIEDAINRLSKEEYEIIYLREYACCSYKELAEIMGISIDNVKIKLFRVREQLRKYLK